MAYYNNCPPHATISEPTSTLGSSPANDATQPSDHQPGDQQQEFYAAYHPSLGPPQAGDIDPSEYENQEHPRAYLPTTYHSNASHPSQDEKQAAAAESHEPAPEVAQVGFFHPQPGYGNRSLSPTLSQGSTNIGSSKIGSPWIGSSVAGDDKEIAKTHQVAAGEVPGAEASTKKRICGVGRRLFWILLALAILIVLGAGLGAGLGVGLSKKGPGSSPASSSSVPSSTNPAPEPTFTGNPQYAIGGVIDPAFYTTTGAYNGSGIAFAGSAFGATLKGLYTVYYQHHSGSIRYLQQTTDGFVGGTESEIVASNAKNATPLSVVQYIVGGAGTGYNPVANWHVFYIGTDGYIKQRIWTNVSNIWTDGPATKQNLKAYNGDSVGLQACWYGNFYGDTAIQDFPTQAGQNTTFLSKYGMNLWYASDESTFQQYAIYQNQTEWKFQKEWRGFNGHAGVGCYSWLPGTTTYAMLVNQQDQVELYWRDTANTSSTETHPTNSWEKADGATIPNVYPSTSLGFTTFFYAMLDNSQIHGYNISFSAENSTFLQPLGTTDPRSITVSDVSGPVKFLNGTHMTVSSLTDQDSGETYLLVFAQTHGDDITLFRRGINGGPWTSGTLPVDPK